jgi:hypothetical protein
MTIRKKIAVSHDQGLKHVLPYARHRKARGTPFLIVDFVDDYFGVYFLAPMLRIIQS